MCVCVCVCTLVTQLCPTLQPQTAACQAPLSMEFSRQEYWSGLPFPSPEDLLHPGIKPMSPALQADSSTSDDKESLLGYAAICNFKFIYFLICKIYLCLKYTNCVILHIYNGQHTDKQQALNIISSSYPPY